MEKDGTYEKGGDGMQVGSVMLASGPSSDSHMAARGGMRMKDKCTTNSLLCEGLTLVSRDRAHNDPSTFPT